MRSQVSQFSGRCARRVSRGRTSIPHTAGSGCRAMAATVGPGQHVVSQHRRIRTQTMSSWRMATATVCVRFRVPSFACAFLKWLRAVSSPNPSALAASRKVSPLDACCNTDSSFGERSARSVADRSGSPMRYVSQRRVVRDKGQGVVLRALRRILVPALREPTSDPFGGADLARQTSSGLPEAQEQCRQRVDHGLARRSVPLIEAALQRRESVKRGLRQRALLHRG